MKTIDVTTFKELHEAGKLTPVAWDPTPSKDTKDSKGKKQSDKKKEDKKPQKHIFNYTEYDRVSGAPIAKQAILEPIDILLTRKAALEAKMAANNYAISIYGK
jgi:hypothetical protein